MVKKSWIKVLMGIVLVAGLTACGDQEAANENAASTAAPTLSPATAAPTNTESGQSAENGLPSLEELIAKSTEASQDLKSFAMDMAISQTIRSAQGEDTQEQAIEMATASEYTKQPLNIHQVVKTNIPGGEAENIEQYITQEGIYTLSGGQWFKMPESMTKQMAAAMEQSASPEKQMEQFRDLTEYTKVTEEDGEYILTANVSGDYVKELAQSYMAQAGGSNAQMTAMMDQMVIKKMNIEYGVDKKTYLPTRTNVFMEMEMAVEGQELSVEMIMDGTIQRHN